MRNKRGISIVEVIVIIFVILFLIAILYPAITKDGAQPKYVICLSNLKQWGLVFLMYCDDNDRKFIEIKNYSNQDKWITELEPYNRYMDEILTCPLAKRSSTNSGEYGGPDSPYIVSIDNKDSQKISIQGSYGINSWVYNPTPDSNIISTYPAENFWGNLNNPNPTKVPVIADAMWYGSFPESNGIAGQPPEENGQWSGTENGMKNFCIDRHKGKIHIVFMDGHVDRVELKDLWKLKWHKNFDTEGPWTKPDAAWPEWMKTLK